MYRIDVMAPGFSILISGAELQKLGIMRVVFSFFGISVIPVSSVNLASISGL